MATDTTPTTCDTPELCATLDSHDVLGVCAAQVNYELAHDVLVDQMYTAHQGGDLDGVAAAGKALVALRAMHTVR
jgi:hypothetical protein